MLTRYLSIVQPLLIFSEMVTFKKIFPACLMGGCDFLTKVTTKEQMERNYYCLLMQRSTSVYSFTNSCSLIQHSTSVDSYL